MIKNIVFDLGGVIVDLSRENAVKEFMAIGLADADTRLDKYHQTGIFQDLEEGKLDEEAFRKELGHLCGRTLEKAEVQKAWLGFIPGVDVRKLDCLENLREQGYRLYLLSNTNPYIMGWACSAGFTGYHKPLDEYMDKMYLSYQIGYTKPDPRIFEFMLEDSGMNPEETLFVDDGKANIERGKELGLHVLLVENATDWREALIKALKVVK
mgnify:CR=1 FL=1